MALVAVALAQCCLHHTDVLAESKLDTEVNSLRQELQSHAAELLSLRSVNAAQNQKLGLVEAELAAVIETVNGQRDAMERRHMMKIKGMCCACKPKTNADAGTDLISRRPAETSPPSATPMSPTATPSTTPSPSVKLITPRTNKPSLVNPNLPASTFTPSPLSKSATSSRTTPSSGAPSVTLAAKALIGLTNPHLAARGPSTPTPSLSVKLSKPGSAKSSPVSCSPVPSGSPSSKVTTPRTHKPNPVNQSVAASTNTPRSMSTATSRTSSRTPLGVTLAAEALIDLINQPLVCSAKSSPLSSKVSPTSRPSQVTSPAAKSKPTKPTTPNKATEAAEATDLISLASAANVASPLPALPLPSNPPTAPRPKPVEVSQAVEEGLISHASAAHAPSPITSLSCPPPDATIGCYSVGCMDIACEVPLPMPDKEEQDFFAADQKAPLSVTRMTVAVKAAPAGPSVAMQVVEQEAQSKLSRPKLEPKRQTSGQPKATLQRAQQKAQPAQTKRELTESKAAQVATLLKYMAYTRKSLNRSSNPAKTFREVDEGLARMRLSIHKLEADYEALKRTGFTHKSDIPELLPRVKRALDESLLER
ncbi:hypothetical protein HDU80_000118 [Chytriomyces hyalinus]|nr:hypothetical protein HDU80_000118 [Chytriomyces hyalinus]